MADRREPAPLRPPARDVQEAVERTTERLREAGASRAWTNDHMRLVRDDVRRGVDEGRIKPAGGR